MACPRMKEGLRSARARICGKSVLENLAMFKIEGTMYPPRFLYFIRYKWKSLKHYKWLWVKKTAIFSHSVASNAKSQSYKNIFMSIYFNKVDKQLWFTSRLIYLPLLIRTGLICTCFCCWSLNLWAVSQCMS